MLIDIRQQDMPEIMSDGFCIYIKCSSKVHVTKYNYSSLVKYTRNKCFRDTMKTPSETVQLCLLTSKQINY